MPPNPRRAAAPGRETEGGGQVKRGGTQQSSEPARSAADYRCWCELCLDGVRPRLSLDAWADLVAIAESPGVVLDMPSSWWHMVALGRDPLTGEVAA